LAGALWVREEGGFSHTFRSDEMTKAMINAMSVGGLTTQEVGAFNSGRGGFYARAEIKEHYQDANQIKLGDGSIEDISWLLPVAKG
jgi:hypothetical protein